MSLSVKYDYPEGAVALYLYIQTGSEITMDALPSGKITLSKDDNEYLVDSPIEGEHYSFIIESVDDDGFNNFSPVQNIIYIRDTGPGNNTILRGEYDFGVMDELTNEEFGMSLVGVRNHFSNKLSSIAAVGANSSGWYKCLVDGRIVYFPKGHNCALLVSANQYNTAPFNSIEAGIINSGLCVTKDGVQTLETDNIININGNEFRWRAMKSWVGDDIRHSPSVWDERSELGMLQTLCNIAHPGNNPELQIPTNSYQHKMTLGENSFQTSTAYWFLSAGRVSTYQHHGLRYSSAGYYITGTSYYGYSNTYSYLVPVLEYLP